MSADVAAPAHGATALPGHFAAPWPAPAPVRALFTTRRGGCSRGPFDDGGGGGGCNLGLDAGAALGLPADDPQAVARNRASLLALVPQMPRWLHQVHGAGVVDAAGVAAEAPPQADAAWTTDRGVVCAVLVADCLPVLLCDAAGRGVAVAHAGWRGLARGVIQEAVRALRAALGDPAAELLACLGPAIGPQHFEVGAEVLAQMAASLPQAHAAFTPRGERYHADLYALARQALAQVGVQAVHGGGWSTYGEPQLFYSYRRERITGRQAALVWLDPPPARSAP